MKIKNKIEITGMIETPLSEEEFHKKFMIILVATCSIYGKIRVRTLLITEQESFDMYFWQNGV